MDNDQEQLLPRFYRRSYQGHAWASIAVPKMFTFFVFDFGRNFNISSSSTRIAAPLAALDAHGYGAHIQAAARVSSVRIAFAAPENLVRTDIGPKKSQV